MTELISITPMNAAAQFESSLTNQLESQAILSDYYDDIKNKNAGFSCSKCEELIRLSFIAVTNAVSKARIDWIKAGEFARRTHLISLMITKEKQWFHEVGKPTIDFIDNALLEWKEANRIKAEIELLRTVSTDKKQMTKTKTKTKKAKQERKPPKVVYIDGAPIRLTALRK